MNEEQIAQEILINKRVWLYWQGIMVKSKIATLMGKETNYDYKEQK